MCLATTIATETVAFCLEALPYTDSQRQTSESPLSVLCPNFLSAHTTQPLLIYIRIHNTHIPHPLSHYPHHYTPNSILPPYVIPSLSHPHPLPLPLPYLTLLPSGIIALSYHPLTLPPSPLERTHPPHPSIYHQTAIFPARPYHVKNRRRIWCWYMDIYRKRFRRSPFLGRGFEGDIGAYV